MDHIQMNLPAVQPLVQSNCLVCNKRFQCESKREVELLALLNNMWAVFCNSFNLDPHKWEEIITFYNQVHGLPFCLICRNDMAELFLFQKQLQNLQVKIQRKTANITAKILQSSQRPPDNNNISLETPGQPKQTSLDNQDYGDVNIMENSGLEQRTKMEVIFNDQVNFQMHLLRQHIAQGFEPHVVLQDCGCQNLCENENSSFIDLGSPLSYDTNESQEKKDRTCYICQRVFARPFTLQRHQSTVHKELYSKKGALKFRKSKFGHRRRPTKFRTRTVTSESDEQVDEVRFPDSQEAVDAPENEDDDIIELIGFKGETVQFPPVENNLLDFSPENPEEPEPYTDTNTNTEVIQVDSQLASVLELQPASGVKNECDNDRDNLLVMMMTPQTQIITKQDLNNVVPLIQDISDSDNFEGDLDLALDPNPDPKRAEFSYPPSQVQVEIDLDSDMDEASGSGSGSGADLYPVQSPASPFEDEVQNRVVLDSRSIRNDDFLQDKVRTPGGKLLCTYPNCGNEYSNVQGLRYHHLVHLGVTFACPVCKRSFSQERALVRHMRTFHPEEDDSSTTSKKRAGGKIKKKKKKKKARRPQPLVDSQEVILLD